MPSPRQIWNQIRNSIASNYQSTGGTGTDPLARGQHIGFTKGISQQLQPWLGSTATRGLVDAAGLFNEGQAGLSEKLQGRKFFSDRGFDWGDIGANYQGTEAGIDAATLNSPLIRRNRGSAGRHQANPFPSTNLGPVSQIPTRPSTPSDWGQINNPEEGRFNTSINVDAQATNNMLTFEQTNQIRLRNGMPPMTPAEYAASTRGNSPVTRTRAQELAGMGSNSRGETEDRNAIRDNYYQGLVDSVFGGADDGSEMVGLRNPGGNRGGRGVPAVLQPGAPAGTTGRGGATRRFANTGSPTPVKPPVSVPRTTQPVGNPTTRLTGMPSPPQSVQKSSPVGASSNIWGRAFGGR